MVSVCKSIRDFVIQTITTSGQEVAQTVKRDKPHLTNKGPGYDTKQSDGEVPVMQELREMRSIPSLPSLPGPVWPGVVAPEIEVFDI